MSGVLSGFFIVWSLIAIGFIAGRTGVLGDPAPARSLLNRVTFFLCGPALVLTALLGSDLGQVLSTPFLVAAVSGLATGAVILVVLRTLTVRRGSELVMTAVSGSVVNGANMGFPIAAYVLGDVAYALPVILFQQAIYTPLYQFALERSTSRNRISPKEVIRSLVAAPTIIASLIGIALVLLKVPVPSLVLQPLDSLGKAAIPLMLVAYGLSLIGSTPFAGDDGYRRLIVLASVAKLVLMPLIALGFGVLLGMHGHQLFAVVVMAALPTAQNVYVAASRYRAAEPLARDTVLVTTVGTVLVLSAVAVLLGA